MASTKQPDVWVCSASSNNTNLFMTPDEFQKWIDYVYLEIVGGGYVNTEFLPDADWRMRKMFIHGVRRFECVENAIWGTMCMYFPIPTYTKRCEFTNGFLFTIGKP